MNPKKKQKSLADVLGMVLGTASLTLSILNYLRDRSHVKVTLHWNMTDTRTLAVPGQVPEQIPVDGSCLLASRRSMFQVILPTS